MTSSVTSSYSADGLSEQSQESAGSLHPDAREKRRRREDNQSQATVHQQMLFGNSDSKTMSFPVQARRRKTHVYVVSHTVEAVVHLWSLGVLTAAGCGIGSVHAVVRSNLLVEPSELE
ncbi:eukaryotic translation initiation factor 2A [Dorcoceras hygrometricum]|uniref:Eukaryotic translation initiation factor 2A n=1 Tax=Dorcoceras hygrometricum TaxID=472368 RepID=A0A2Z7A3B6_9LAMI|nr:eukaryotic translation initiation factor 2A [Dorcoceras hygrometricum]